ncbi:hypothetical protein MKEN_00014300 [Mycena kentingensis (nom. inval.)]|nr:hypothetical protein MKEN_00014300 [Mycena kentingensis (nom. inval.)]
MFTRFVVVLVLSLSVYVHFASALSVVPPRRNVDLALSPRGTALNSSLIPDTCVSACQPALDAQSKCGTDLSCICSSDNAQTFAQCITCAVDLAVAAQQPGDTLAQNAGQGVVDDFVAGCAADGSPISSPSLSFAGGAAPTGIIAPKTGGGSFSHATFGGFAFWRCALLVALPWYFSGL